MQLKDLLNKYECRMGVTNDYIAEHIGVNKLTVSRWMKGETKVMEPTVIGKLSYLLGTDVESSLKNSDRFEKPLLRVVKTGCELSAEENLAGYEEVSKSDYYRSDYFFRICGDSITGAHIHDQGLICIKQCDDVKSGTITVILIGNTKMTAKRITKKEPFLILETTNPTVSTRYFTQEEVRDLPVRIIGKVLYNRSGIA